MVADLSHWEPCDRPGKIVLQGAYARLEPIDYKVHICGLFAAICGAGDDDVWTYLPGGPYRSAEQLQAVLKGAHAQHGWETMIIRCAQSAEILGMASYMRNREEHGSTEVGCVTFSKKLQRSRIGTDAMYLMAHHVFAGLGYRRYEWKCNDLNEASKRAAFRFGFQYEGLFRNDMVRDGVSRDTAWYAMIDTDWPAVEKAFQLWLEPSNFDAKGLQVQKLVDLRNG